MQLLNVTKTSEFAMLRSLRGHCLFCEAPRCATSTTATQDVAISTCTTYLVTANIRKYLGYDFECVTVNECRSSVKHWCRASAGSPIPQGGIMLPPPCITIELSKGCVSSSQAPALPMRTNMASKYLHLASATPGLGSAATRRSIASPICILKMSTCTAQLHPGPRCGHRVDLSREKTDQITSHSSRCLPQQKRLTGSSTRARLKSSMAKPSGWVC